MKILYLTLWDFEDSESNGVCKKIKAQINAFEQAGFQTDLIYFQGDTVIYKKNEKKYPLFRVKYYQKLFSWIKLFKYIKSQKYDWIYNRYEKMNPFSFRVLQHLRKNSSGLLIEIPTYPYASDQGTGIIYQIMYKLDDIYSKKLKQIVTRVVTFSKYEKIFDIPTIKTINGIELTEIRPVSPVKYKEDTIRLLVVAVMQKRHGYERLLLGLKNYYEKGGNRSIICHFVGDGPQKKVYEAIVNKYDMQDNVIFYGLKKTIELDEIYEKIDIGIGVLGIHHDGALLSSDLKSREYLAKGIPVIGCQVDLFVDNPQPFYLDMPLNDTAIDIDQVVTFYDSIYRNREREEVIATIRSFAEVTIDMPETMKPVISYMNLIGNV